MAIIDFSNLNSFLLNESHFIKPFDCGDEDLNSFLFYKAILYKKELLATTFIIENQERTIAYYTLFNDCLRVEETNFTSKSSIKRFLRTFISHPKRHLNSFPAIKIRRLAIDESFKGKGLGRLIINTITHNAINTNNYQACKFITVDAYHTSLIFYERLGFKYLSENDQYEDTRQMYLDLTNLV
ncbi:MAG: GNAT family N-acetyltransferase [Myroides sp.]|jgi:GNAT superfamily N-acetyltransferase|nr:GNAT family N-acetyltransferase [Myroides sp.]